MAMFMDFLIYFSDICSQNSNIVLQRISFTLGDKSTTNMNLQKGIYIFINNHILVNPIQVTFIVVNNAFPVNVTHLTQSDTFAVEIIEGETHNDIIFNSKHYCAGRLYYLG